MNQKQIIIPDLGLFQNRSKHLVPLQSIGGNRFRCGLSYCRNVSLSRKDECLMKSKGTSQFTASATGSTDSVRGIGILNKFDRPNNYQYPNATIKRVAASADDGRDDGTAYVSDGDYIKIGNDDGTAYDGIFRFLGLTISQSTVIQSAVLRMYAKSKEGNILDGIVKADDQNNPGQISGHSDYAGRTTTTETLAFSKLTSIHGKNGSLLHLDITAIVQELVNSYAYSNQAMQFFVQDNASSEDNWIRFYSFDQGTFRYYASLEIVVTDPAPQKPSYFMLVKGATAGEAWKLNENKTPSEITQAAHSYAGEYQSQIARFKQFGDDLLISDDGYEYPQQWDWSDSPSALEDVFTTLKARYINEFKARMWYWWVNYGGTIYKSRGYYSNVNDPTTIDTHLSLTGSDAITFAINLTQDEQIVFKEGSSHRIVDRQTSASDFQPYVISLVDGSLGANIISDGARLYGINMQGVFQWPVGGYPNGFRYISRPIQDEIDKVPLTSMNLVWFAFDPIKKLIFMHYPDEGDPTNSLCAVFNIDRDCWENISDIWEANVMLDCFDLDGKPIMLFGQEDGHLKYIDGDDDEDSDYTGRLDTGAIFQEDAQGKLLSRKLTSIEPDTNYDGSMTLNFYFKGYDRPDEEADASWLGPYTHDSMVAGNKEFIPINDMNEYQYHIIRVDGTLKDEAFEIYSLGLNFVLGSR